MRFPDDDSLHLQAHPASFKLILRAKLIYIGCNCIEICLHTTLVIDVCLKHYASSIGIVNCAHQTHHCVSKLILGTLKVKPEKWGEMDEEALFPIKDFLDTASPSLFITLGDRDKIQASLRPEGVSRKKSCYFLKVTGTALLHTD